MRYLSKFILFCIVLFAQPGFAEVVQFKNETVQKVFNDLKSVKGILPQEAPFLVLDEVFVGVGNITMAYIDYGTNIIHLEERVYDICTDKLGVDSLNGIAFILGHELAHYINRHEDVSHHVPASTSKVLGDSVLMGMINNRIDPLGDTLANDIAIAIGEYNERNGEAVADLEGGFIAYLAGYHSDRDLPTLPALFLSEVYANIGMDSVVAGYPKLEERQAIASSSKVVLDSLIFLYDMANSLIAIEHYGEAINYLELLAKTFDSRELYNNMGVAAIFDALQCFDSHELPRRMPITLDLDSRMGGNGKGRADYTEKIRNLKIQRAIGYLEKSAYMDDSYAIALLNLSVARQLQSISYQLSEELIQDKTQKNALAEEQSQLALSAAIKAKIVAHNNLSSITDSLSSTKKIESILSNIYVQMSSLNTQRGDSLQANANLIIANEWNPKNMLLNQSSDQFNFGVGINKCNKVEAATDSEDLLDVIGSIGNDWSSPVNILKKRGRRHVEFQNFKEFENENYAAYMHTTEMATIPLNELAILYPKRLSASSCGVKIGDSKDVIVNLYGIPRKSFPVSNGSYYTYKSEIDNTTLSHGIVFELDRSNKVKRWFSFVEDSAP